MIEKRILTAVLLSAALVSWPLGSGAAKPDSTVLYVAAGSHVDVYTTPATHPTLVKRITTGLSEPYGLWIDRLGTLYVADLGVAAVLEYRSAVTPPIVHVDPGQLPAAVTKCADGTLYAANWYSTMGASVRVYARESLHPTGFIAQPYYYWVTGVACDSTSNVYVSYQYGSLGGGIDVYPPGGRGMVTHLPQFVLEPEALTIDRVGDMFVSDGASYLRVFHPQDKRQFRSFYDDPWALAPTSDDAQFWQVQSVGIHPIPEAQLVTWGSKRILQSIDYSGSDYPQGIAVFPPDHP